MKTAHLGARTFFTVLSCLARAHLSTFNHACTRGSRLHKSLCTCDVWSGLPHCASKNTSSSLMSHPNLLGLDPESFTSFFSAPPQPPHTTRSTEPERASLTELRCHLSATSPERQSGYLADSIPLTELVRRSVHPCEQKKVEAEARGKNIRCTSEVGQGRAGAMRLRNWREDSTAIENGLQSRKTQAAEHPTLRRHAVSQGGSERRSRTRQREARPTS